MKKVCVLLSALVLLPALSACNKGYDYTAHLSEVRSDLFVCECEAFELTLACLSREYPYASDGVACPRTDTVEVEIKFENAPESVSIEIEGGYGGEASYRNVKDDWYYSVGVKEFPKGSVLLTVSWEEEKKELAATSVKTETTLSPEDALSLAVGYEKERVEQLTKGGDFFGEFRVRLLRRDKNYYYVGIVGTDKSTLSLLLDAESGKLLARRESG